MCNHFTIIHDRKQKVDFSGLHTIYYIWYAPMKGEIMVRKSQKTAPAPSFKLKVRELVEAKLEKDGRPDVSQAQVAEEMSLTASVLNRYMRGYVGSRLDIAHLVKVARWLGIEDKDIHLLYEFVDEEQKQ